MSFRQEVIELLERFTSGPLRRYTIPYDNIAMIDSRMWDPKWRNTYGSSYNTLVTANSALMGGGRKNLGRAYSLASGESYFWGARGGRPVGVLKALSNVNPRDVARRVRTLLRNLISGDDLEERIVILLRTLGYGPDGRRHIIGPRPFIGPRQPPPPPPPPPPRPASP